MLFENRVQVTAEYLMTKYATLEDYKKIQKKPSFEVAKHRKKIDKVNGGVIKVPKANGIRSSFFTTDKTTGLKTEIRYAISHNPRVIGNQVIDNYEPRYVNFDGATKAFQDDLDLAIFWFLSATNELSPLRDKNNKSKPKVVYIDTKKRSEAKSKDINAATEAMAHAHSLKLDDAFILAKGLGLKNVDKKDAEDVKVDVQEFAMKFPKIYNEKVNSQITYIEGRILHLIDRGVVTLKTHGTVRVWSWAKGELSGERITDVVNQTQDAKAVLRNFFFNDINKWLPYLNSMASELTAREKAEFDLSKASVVYVDAPEETAIGDALPDHLKERETFTYPTTASFNEGKKMMTKEEAIEILKAENGGKEPHHLTVASYLKNANA